LKKGQKCCPETSVWNCHYAPRKIPEERRSDEALYLSGKGHLACVSFAGGRAFPRRKNLFADEDRVKNDVQYLSHYKKNIDAADNPRQASAGGKDNARLLTTRDNQCHSSARLSHFVSDLTNQLLGWDPRRNYTLVSMINLQKR